MQEKGKILYMDGMGPADLHTGTAADVAVDTPAEALSRLVDSIQNSGMDPVVQLLGYFITEDPTYLPEGINARNLAHSVGRDKLLEAVLTLYMEHHISHPEDHPNA